MAEWTLKRHLPVFRPLSIRGVLQMDTHVCGWITGANRHTAGRGRPATSPQHLLPAGNGDRKIYTLELCPSYKPSVHWAPTPGQFY